MSFDSEINSASSMYVCDSLLLLTLLILNTPEAKQNVRLLPILVTGKENSHLLHTHPAPSSFPCCAARYPTPTPFGVPRSA